MTPDKEILIIGAGSTGLSAALFLAEAGFRPRIVEKRSQPSTITKALGINPVTLQLLESSGVTQRFLENGWTAGCFNFWSKGRIVYKNDFSKIKHKYPFMLVQPQYETEAILEEALAQRGIYVERGVTLEDLTIGEASSRISLNAGGALQTFDFGGTVIGADGNKSAVRDKAGIAFRGWEHHEPFHFYDLELDTPLSPNEGHYFFYPEGGMLMLHIHRGIWRVGGNIKDMLNYLPRGTKTGAISWDTTFSIREKVAATFTKGNVTLLGDAAHIHSPAGAKGMNLCIEDAYIFSQLFAQRQQQRFSEVRRPKIKKAVNILGQLTDKVAGNNFAGRAIRANMDKLAVFFPLVMPQIRKFLLGLS